MLRYTKEGMVVDYENLIVQPLIDRARTTPDFRELMNSDYHVVFVYDSLQIGGSNHFHITDYPYLGKAHTVTSFWKMRQSSWMPVVFDTAPEETGNNAIRGEAYLVNAEVIHLLDRFEMNGRMHRRRKVKIYLEEQELVDFQGSSFQNKPWTDAWMYIGVPSYYTKEDSFHLAHSIRYKGTRFPERTFYEWFPKKVDILEEKVAEGYDLLQGLFQGAEQQHWPNDHNYGGIG